MHDGIQFEKRGLPAAVICTEPFVSSAVAMSKMGGIPDFPFAVVPHPLGSLDENSLRERAKEVAGDIVKILLEG
ncbi:MAG TPA: hypothetical protein DDW46_07155 [Dehalococcoidia bacterium]|nr:hypothetical protein [Dehalococcoidia bacterium]HIA75086.1 hypothetical protein [Dehalococcoidia bacterium]